MFGEKEWYFFSSKDRKYPNGSRPNKVAWSGYRKNAMQRNLDVALQQYTLAYSTMVAQSSPSGWRLLTLVFSAQERLKDAEAVVDLALEEVGEMDRFMLLRLKAALQIAQEQPKLNIVTHEIILTQLQAMKEITNKNSLPKTAVVDSLLLEAWLDLAKIYISVESLPDAETCIERACIERAKSIKHRIPKCWHASGEFFKAQSLYKEALKNFTISLTMKPNYVPSIVSLVDLLMNAGHGGVPVARSLLVNAVQVEFINHDSDC